MKASKRAANNAHSCSRVVTPAVLLFVQFDAAEIKELQIRTIICLRDAQTWRVSSETKRRASLTQQQQRNNKYTSAHQFSQHCRVQPIVRIQVNSANQTVSSRDRNRRLIHRLIREPCWRSSKQSFSGGKPRIDDRFSVCSARMPLRMLKICSCETTLRPNARVKSGAREKLLNDIKCRSRRQVNTTRRSRSSKKLPAPSTSRNFSACLRIQLTSNSLSTAHAALASE